MDQLSPVKTDTVVKLSPSTATIDMSNDQKRRRYDGVHIKTKI